MNRNYPLSPTTSTTNLDPAFAASGERFSSLIQSITALRQASHADIERSLATEGWELMRQIYQDELHRQAAAQMSEAPSGVDAEVATRRWTKRDLRTAFGEVVVRRSAWKEPETGGVRPLEAKLNLPSGLYSHGITEQLGAEVSQVSFDRAVENLCDRGITVPNRQAEELTAGVAVYFDDFYATARGAMAPTTTAHLVMSLDRKGIAMRREDLRPETKKKAEKNGKKVRSRLGSG